MNYQNYLGMSLRKEWPQDAKNRRRFSKPLSFASFICGDREKKDLTFVGMKRWGFEVANLSTDKNLASERYTR